MIFLFERIGKSINRAVVKCFRNIRDSIIVFLQQLAAFFKSQITNIAFGGLIDFSNKHILQKGPGDGELLADFVHSDRIIGFGFDICNDLAK